MVPMGRIGGSWAVYRVPPPPQPSASPAPQRIDVKVGFSCNNRCVFCVQGDRREHERDRSGREVFTELVRGRAAGATGVVLTGGEVTLRRDLLTLVRGARELGFSTIQLQTNGRRLADRGFVEAAVDAGVTEWSPALHGPTPEGHDALTGVPGAWKDVTAGLRHLQDLQQVVLSNSVVVRANLRHLEALARLLVGLGVGHYQLAMVHALGSAAARFDDVVPRLEEAAPWVRAALRVGREAGVTARVEAMPFCLLHGFEGHASEGEMPRTRVLDPALDLLDYTRWRVTEGKAKGPACGNCSWNSRCEGPWREYPEAFGWEALHPRTDDPLVLGPPTGGGGADPP